MKAVALALASIFAFVGSAVGQFDEANNQPEPFDKIFMLVGFGWLEDHATVSFGVRWQRLGVEFGIIDNADIRDEDFVDSRIPHGEFTDLGWIHNLPTWGMDVVGFLPVLSRVQVYGGAGAYFDSRVRIAQSDVTGIRWKQEEELGFIGTLTAGLHLVPGTKLMFGLGYHTIRGPNLVAGFRF